MANFCSWALKAFGLAYVIALLLFLIGTFGWFGSETGPLAGVFLLPLGLPWNRMLDWSPDTLRPWLAAAAPLVNLALLGWLCRRLG